MSHYKNNVRDQVFNLFEVLGVDKALGEGAYADLDVDTATEMLGEMVRLAEGPIAESFADGDRNPQRQARSRRANSRRDHQPRRYGGERDHDPGRGVSPLYGDERRASANHFSNLGRHQPLDRRLARPHHRLR